MTLVVVPYRPYGKSRGVPWLPAGDQWPDAPDELRAAVDGRPRPSRSNRVGDAIYRWLADPHVVPRRWRRRRSRG